MTADQSKILSVLDNPALITIAVNDWFDLAQLPTFLAAVVAILTVLYTTFHRKGREGFKIREIAGLKAVEEAIGRATEMARPILFTPGWGGDIQRPTTIAALNILSSVAEKTAEYNSQLLFPTHDPVIMSVAQEVIAESYNRAGYPERFNIDDTTYVSPSQFGYAAAVEGMIMRLKPASIFLLGTFEAESLILAETGNIAGSIQIAGTDSTIQLAFFIVACDYTLIGEELFAASGYLSKDKSIMASIRAQDIMKVIIAAVIVLAIISAFVAPLSDWWKF